MRVFLLILFSNYCDSPSDKGIPFDWEEVNNAALVYGIPNFGNFFNSTLTVFQSLTTEGWSANMYLVLLTLTGMLN